MKKPFLRRTLFLGVSSLIPMLFSLPVLAEEQDVGATSAQADYLCLYTWNQAENSSWPIGQVRKLVFSNTDLSVSLWEGEDTYTLPYGNVRKITFEEEALADVIEATKMARNIYYNASLRSLVVTNNNSSGHLQLYNMSGSLVFSASVGEGQSLYSLTNLLNGMYVAKLTNQEQSYLLKLQIH